VIGVVLISFVTYQWIIPRTNLEVRTVYHESPGGGGTGGVINLNVLLTNWGNREISDLDCLVIVRNDQGDEVARNEIESMVLNRGENAEIKLTFIGSQYVGYVIFIDIEFLSSGDRHGREIDHDTIEEQMNLVFVDNIR
jgi:hypothetical protein